MPLGRLVVIALGICVAAGVITAIADKGESEPATAAEANKAAVTPVAEKPFPGRTAHAGNAPHVCTIHPTTMQARIVVTKPS